MNELAMGLGLGLGIPAIVAMLLAYFRQSGCGGCSTMCCGHHVHSDSHGFGHYHGHGLPSRLAIRVNVDELRDFLLRVLDTPVIQRLHRHRRDINQLRQRLDNLNRDHGGLEGRFADHIASPHDTAAITALIAEERERSERALADLKRDYDERIGNLETALREHRHRISLHDIVLATSKRLRALVIAAVVFVVVLLCNFYLPWLKERFIETLHFVYHSHSYPIYGLIWDWSRIGLAFAVALVVYTIVNILSERRNTARTVTDELTSTPV